MFNRKIPAERSQQLPARAGMVFLSVGVSPTQEQNLDLNAHTRGFRESHGSGVIQNSSPGATKSEVVVPVVRIVPVAVGTAHVVLIVVPRAAANHFRSHPSEKPRLPVSECAMYAYRHGKHGRSSSVCVVEHPAGLSSHFDIAGSFSSFFFSSTTHFLF